MVTVYGDRHATPEGFECPSCGPSCRPAPLSKKPREELRATLWSFLFWPFWAMGPKIGSQWGSSHLSLVLPRSWGTVGLLSFCPSPSTPWHFPKEGIECQVQPSPGTCGSLWCMWLDPGLWLALPPLRACGNSSPLTLLTGSLRRLVGGWFGGCLLWCHFFWKCCYCILLACGMCSGVASVSRCCGQEHRGSGGGALARGSKERPELGPELFWDKVLFVFPLSAQVREEGTGRDPR